MAKSFKAYLSILVIYFVIDLSFQFSIGLNLTRGIYADAGITDILTKQPGHAWTIPLFFVAIAYVLLKLAVEPALEKGRAGLAFFNGFLVGFASYGTLALVCLWLIKDFPVCAAFVYLFEGSVFPTVSSGLTALWLVRRA